MKTAELRDILKSLDLWLRRLKGGAGANLADQDFTGRSMPRLNLCSAILTGVDFSHCTLINAVFAEANLFAADFSGADLTDADLSRADLAGPTLRCADLRCADLSRSNLMAADLSGANLTGANLSASNLSGANLSDTAIDGAVLTGAEVVGVQFSGTDTSAADMKGARIVTLVRHLREDVRATLTEHRRWIDSLGASGAAPCPTMRISATSTSPISI